MNTALNAVLIAALLLLAAWALRRTLIRSRKGGGCCGDHEAAEKKVTVSDRNKAHYPYAVSLQIGGMTCENCARKVENALNRLDGTWAIQPSGRNLGHCLHQRRQRKSPEQNASG